MSRSKKIEPSENQSAFKHLYGREYLKRTATAISAHYSEFDRKRWLGLMNQLAPLEMKPRVRFLRDELRTLLPKDYEVALEILLRAAGGKVIRDFDLWPITEFIQVFGIDRPDLSLEALKQITVLFTSEWAIRPFIKSHPRKAMKFLLKCAHDQNPHVRRWASEGTRPRLPWGERLQEFIADPTPSLEILEVLKFDPELYVRKSVANHLNDIAKDHPDFVITTLKEWLKKAKAEDSAKMDWIVRRSLRTLIKDGHPKALAIIGVSTKVAITVNDFKIRQKKIKLGERLDFQFEIKSLAKTSQKLVIDYRVHFVKANKSTAPKVFKLKTLLLPAQGKILIQKSHPFKRITTREYYPGLHHLEIQINGRVISKGQWNLEL